MNDPRDEEALDAFLNMVGFSIAALQLEDDTQNGPTYVTAALSAILDYEMERLDNDFISERLKDLHDQLLAEIEGTIDFFKSQEAEKQAATTV